MKFQYDDQTFSDLEIIKDHRDPEKSIFTIFNHTLTEGGSDYLKLLIKHPTSDIHTLQKRVDLIHYFKEKNITLFINSRQFKFIEKYLNLNISVLKNNPIDLIYYRVTEWISPTNDYYLLRSGCQNLLEVIQALRSNINFESLPPLLIENVKTIKKLIQELSSDQYQIEASHLSWKKTIKLDRLFRITYAKKLRTFLDEVYFIDAFLAVAKVSKKNSFVLPVYMTAETPKLSIKGLRHPLLYDAISNDIDIGTHNNMCFLTGPNMAGKSTFLKSLGIAVYLSHLGFPVPAKEMKTSVYDGLITTINLSDNLGFGHSHFYSEVQRVKEAAKALSEKKQMLIIFDELFRGTNVKDALEASSAIINAFAEFSNCTFFISTHIVEIAKEIQDKESIIYKYFKSELIDNTLTYSYKLKNGISDERLGMYIVRKEGILDLLQKAKNA